MGGPPGVGEGLRPQQSTHAQLKPTIYERTTSVSVEGVRVETAARVENREIPLGEFTATQTKNGFRVGHVSRELDTARRRPELSSSGKPATEFLSPPMVERLIDDDGSVYAQFVGSKNYYRFTREREPTATVPAGFDARVADVKPFSESYQVAMVTPETVLTRLAGDLRPDSA